MLDFDFASSISGMKTKSTQIRQDDRLASLIERADIEREATRVLDLRSRHTLTPVDAKMFAAALDTAPSPTSRALKAGRNCNMRVVRAD